MKVFVDRWRELINNWNNNQIVPNTETIGDTQPTRENRIAINIVSIE
jgi:hypothetical protein